MTKERFKTDELKPAEPPFDKYVGSYVIISNVNGRSKMGKLIGFSQGCAFLNPFLGVDYSSGEPVRTLIEDTELVSMPPTDELEPTTRKSLEGYCKFQNWDYQTGKNLREKQLKDNGIEQDKKK